MAVSALKERRIAMTGKVGNRLLIDTAMQQGRDKIVPQRVKIIFFRETVFVIDPTQMPGEGVRVDKLPLIVGEEI